MSTTGATVPEQLRAVAAGRGEELIAEFVAAVRRVGLFMVVLAIAVPLFLAGCLTVLAWALLG